MLYDLKDNLHLGLLLREKDFREFLKTHDWSLYAGCHVAITCTEDAIVPTWAYMLLAVHLAPHARTVVYGPLERLEEELFLQQIEHLDPEAYRGARVVVKGCSDGFVPTAAYVALSCRLQPVVQSLLFGEPCSTVPLYKRKRDR